MMNKYFSPDTIKDDYVTSRTRWKAVQVLTKMFWRHFIQKYLPILQIPKKFNKAPHNLKQNNLLLIRQDNIPRSHWLLAKIIETHPGKDGIVCSAKVKLPHSVLTRPCNKLCMLEECNWSNWQFVQIEKILTGGRVCSVESCGKRLKLYEFYVCVLSLCFVCSYCPENNN